MFKSLATLEAEVVGISASLLGARAARGISPPADPRASPSASARRPARAGRAAAPDQARLVLPVSAHPAFDRAARSSASGREDPLTKDYVADVEAMAHAVTNDAIGLVASAPNYPFGTIDPVPPSPRSPPGQAPSPRRRLRGRVRPAVSREARQPIPPFDFTVPRCRRLADLQSTAAARGTSLVLYGTRCFRAAWRSSSTTRRAGPIARPPWPARGRAA